MTDTVAKTAQDVEALKENWLADPCWDIEETDGFEAYKEELLAFHIQQEARWEEQRQERIHNKAKELGLQTHPHLAEYVLNLEDRLTRMQEEIDALKNH